MSAASGSAHRLNSAAADTLPNVPPPINEMPAMREPRSGAARSANAIFVSGPIGTNHTPSVALHVSIMKSTASSLSGPRDGSGKSAPSSPLFP